MRETVAPEGETLVQRLGRLRAVAERQLFFVGGAPRSGTTWLQQMLDAHPAVSCRGEGLFWKHLAVPIDQMMVERGKAIAGKNERLFQHTGGYPLPQEEDGDTVFGAGVLAALDRQLQLRPDGGVACLAVGEKTPENVFLFPRLKRLFPESRLLVIARDPRDVIASAWHIFVLRENPNTDMSSHMENFVRLSLDSMERGACSMVAQAADPDGCMLLTYEALTTDTAGLLGSVFRFLGVPDDRGIVSACVTAASFERHTGGRARGTEQADSFLRRGAVGTWRDTLNDHLNAMILDRLGWMFPRFGWIP